MGGRFLTQLEAARRGVTTTEMAQVARTEGVGLAELMASVAQGTVVIPRNRNHKNVRPVGIGKGLSVKVNVNIGVSETTSCPTEELEKLRLSLRLGADTVMDLSVGKNVDEVRAALMEECPIPLGTVPVYQAASEHRSPADLTPDVLLRVIESQAKQGVDFMTIHAGVLRSHLQYLEGRVTGIVSRGGALMAHYIKETGRENPLYEAFDEILDIARGYDVTLSLGDGLRPGCIHDASDKAQYAELYTLGELAERAREAGVQVMIEGPGHVPLHLIEENVRKEKEICKGAPFYVLGPLVTDVGAGYDHITGAIGAALAAWYGADFLCYVTPAEHLGLPTLEDVRKGLVAFKIAAHAADIARGRKEAVERDLEMSRARFQFDWEKQYALSVDPEMAREVRERTLPGPTYKESRFCSMCGPRYCPMKLSQDLR